MYAPHKLPTQHREKQPVARLEARLPDLPAKNRQLVPEHENLQLLGAIAASDQHDELQQRAHEDARRRHLQRRPPVDGDADATAALSGLRASAGRVSAPHALGLSHEAPPASDETLPVEIEFEKDSGSAWTPI